MALKLNATRETYCEFYGKNVEQMPKLIADCRVPMSVAGLMQRRLDVRNSDADVNSSYLNNYFDTGDAVVYHPDGSVKIVLDSQTLRDLTPESTRSKGALILASDVYDTLQGEEFKKGKLGKTESPLSRKDVKSHPVWKVLARDQGLLNDYANYIFPEGKERFSFKTAMGIYLDSKSDNVKMRAWFVNWLKNRSSADGRGGHASDLGRLIGIAPEALSTPGNGASNIKSFTMADLKSFDSAVKELEAIVRPELLTPFVQLRKKL